MTLRERQEGQWQIVYILCVVRIFFLIPVWHLALHVTRNELKQGGEEANCRRVKETDRGSEGDRMLMSEGDRLLMSEGDRLLMSEGDRLLMSQGDRLLISEGDRF